MELTKIENQALKIIGDEYNREHRNCAIANIYAVMVYEYIPCDERIDGCEAYLLYDGDTENICHTFKEVQEAVIDMIEEERTGDSLNSLVSKVNEATTDDELIQLIKTIDNEAVLYTHLMAYPKVKKMFLSEELAENYIKSKNNMGLFKNAYWQCKDCDDLSPVLQHGLEILAKLSKEGNIKMTNKIKNNYNYIWVIELEDNVWFSGKDSRTICTYNAKKYYDQEEAQRSLAYAMRYSEINRFKNIKIKQMKVTYERCCGK